MSGGGFGQPQSGAYGSPNYDSSAPVNQAPMSGMGMGGMGMGGMGMSGAQPTMAESQDMSNPYFAPRSDYMYGAMNRSMAQFNPFLSSYFSADPMYGGYSPFIPQLPDDSMYAQDNELADMKTGFAERDDPNSVVEKEKPRMNQFGMASGGAVYDSGIKSI